MLYKPKKWDKKWDKAAEKCENGAKMQVFLSKMPVFEGALHPVNPCVVSSSLTGAAKTTRWIFPSGFCFVYPYQPSTDERFVIKSRVVTDARG